MNAQKYIMIDGVDGGGQMLRTSLALSMITGKPFKMVNIRTARPNPGLQPQHLEAVNAAQQICDAKVEGAAQRSLEITFAPGEIKSGSYEFRIKSAGSASLLFHAVYLPLAMQQSPSELLFQGGTHVSWSPTFDYINECWVWFMNKMGLKIQVSMEKAGFYPHGGGLIKAIIHPLEKIVPIKLLERGKLVNLKIYSAHTNLRDEVAKRQAEAAQRILISYVNSYENMSVQCGSLSSLSRNTTIAISAVFEQTVCCFTGLGEKGKLAEQVAAEACNKFISFLDSGATADEFMSDQLLLPLVQCSELSEFTCNRYTSHAKSNLETIRKFLDITCQVKQLAPHRYEFEVGAGRRVQ
ncbi:MAG: RNA 3'-terminal-phosphate cyclase [Candidatus Fischerbacteria bacterium RBG_13_37_8]|uniref:RNA 3'-terminal phosphate cyclase n=1 Tax=Candidatus Fischerbacteria bacterium RBG_13_37_8 TaxID=1817863 RepID=A0A1F5VSU0_9BACT|nr:MAG: RNA 3'-terminal-phosphate cyclase [Candidatus Fischerbacteria bacterium RBG_13_37_8]